MYATVFYTFGLRINLDPARLLLARRVLFVCPTWA